MRVTIDLDSSSRINLRWACLKGRILCHKPVDRIYATRRGFHCIWDNVCDNKGVPITEEKSIRLRKSIGDDENRISLDSHTRRVRQVLFSNKKITYVSEDGFITKQEEFIRRQIK